MVADGDEDGWRGHLEAYFPQETSAVGREVPLGFRREPPGYVSLLLSNDMPADLALAGERSDLPLVQGVAVFDARGA
jgi:hypothetical protein